MKLRRPALFFFTLALILIGAAILTNVVPYKQIVDQNRQVEAARAELQAMQEENAVLAAQRDALQTPVEIERLAREKLGYVRPGEVAYVVLDPPEDATTSTSIPVEAPLPPEDESLLETVWEFVTGADLSE